MFLLYTITALFFCLHSDFYFSFCCLFLWLILDKSQQSADARASKCVKKGFSSVTDCAETESPCFQPTHAK